MPLGLGLLAKDSIQDLVALHHKESDIDETDNGSVDDTVIPEDISKERSASVHEPLKPAPLTKRESFLQEEETAAAAAAAADNQENKLPNSKTAANPQQAQEEEDKEKSPRRRFPQTTTSYGQYTGFQTTPTDQQYTYYAEHQHHQQHDHHHHQSNNDTYYYHDTYAPVVLSQRNQSGLFPNLICCLFPWMSQPPPPPAERQATDFDAESYEQETVDNSSPTITTNTASSTTAASATATADTTEKSEKKQDDDEISSGSDVLGEKLSDKERQAVLARLGLGQPDSDASDKSAGAGDHHHHQSNNNSNSNSATKKKGLFVNGIPTYDTSPLHQPGPADENKPLRGILKRGSTLDMKSSSAQSASQDKLSQDSDSGKKRRNLFPSYSSVGNSKSLRVSFAPMARVVTVRSKNSMMGDEKADVWWQRSDYEEFRKTGRIVTKAMLTGGSEIWLANTTSTNDDKAMEEASKTGDKWWHRFGHSRRGLEHVVSMEEGRDRQINVRNAIRAVIDEHKRQKLYKREDPEKLRIVALNHTTWAKDLALAAGASDADAVKSAFAEDRKSREFYLLKMARTKPVQGRNMPRFMVPETHKVVTSPGRRVIQQRLDANTAAQLCYRRRRIAADTSASTPSSQRKEITEPIHDPDPEDHTKDTLAHRAAGFMVEGGEKVDMAAVLSGMGAVPQESSAS